MPPTPLASEPPPTPAPDEKKSHPGTGSAPTPDRPDPPPPRYHEHGDWRARPSAPRSPGSARHVAVTASPTTSQSASGSGPSLQQWPQTAVARPGRRFPLRPAMPTTSDCRRVSADSRPGVPRDWGHQPAPMQPLVRRAAPAGTSPRGYTQLPGHAALSPPTAHSTPSLRCQSMSLPVD